MIINKNFDNWYGEIPALGGCPDNGIYYDKKHDLWFIDHEVAMKVMGRNHTKIKGESVIVCDQMLGMRTKYRLFLISPDDLFSSDVIGALNLKNRLYGTRILYDITINDKPIYVSKIKGLISDGKELYIKSDSIKPGSLETQSYICDNEEIQLAKFPESTMQKLKNEFYPVFKTEIFKKIQTKSSFEWENGYFHTNYDGKGIGMTRTNQDSLEKAFDSYLKTVKMYIDVLENRDKCVYYASRIDKYFVTDKLSKENGLDSEDVYIDSGSINGYMHMLSSDEYNRGLSKKVKEGSIKKENISINKINGKVPKIIYIYTDDNTEMKYICVSGKIKEIYQENGIQVYIDENGENFVEYTNNNINLLISHDYYPIDKYYGFISLSFGRKNY